MKNIIIGNGFDLNLGLKTSYSDFIANNSFILLIEKNNSLARYLYQETQLKNWIDIEKEIVKYSNNVDLDRLNVKKDFNELKTALLDYLKIAQAKEINKKSKAFEIIEKEIDSIDKIYNFNYTNSIFKIAETLNFNDIKNKHYYVHGSIDNSDIILGVQDNAKINSNHIFFKKSYNENFATTNITKELDECDELIIFGHSLGITDSSYFSDYIHRLSIHQKNKKLTFYYYKEEGYDDMMKIINDYTRNSLTKFKHYCRFKPIDVFNLDE